MIIQGTITDYSTGELLPFVSIYESDSKGKPVGAGTSSSNSGDYSINIKPGNFVTASLVGYGKEIFSPGGINGEIHDFRLKTGNDLPTVNVTGKKTYWREIGILGLAFYLLTSMSNKKKH